MKTFHGWNDQVADLWSLIRSQRKVFLRRIFKRKGFIPRADEPKWCTSPKIINLVAFYFMLTLSRRYLVIFSPLIFRLQFSCPDCCVDGLAPHFPSPPPPLHPSRGGVLILLVATWIKGSSLLATLHSSCTAYITGVGWLTSLVIL